MRLSLLVILPFLGLAACATETEEAEGSEVDAILALTGDTAAGETVFTSNCAGCHGADGTGGSGPNIVGESAEDIAEAVLYGEGDMPAFGDTLEDQDIADVIAFLNQ
jgi:mono/diheme cytochrome c family protein